MKRLVFHKRHTRKRYAELEGAGRLKPPGIERPPTDRGCPAAKSWG